MRVPFLSFSEINQQIMPEMLDAFRNVFTGGWYILGDYLKKFEREYAFFNSTQFCVGTSNGLDALILALKALGIGPGDEVVVPSNTFIATVLAVAHVGAKPVFAEPDIKTYNIDINKFGSLIGPDTKAVIPVHLFGQACEMDMIMNIARSRQLYVIEDNAQAHGAGYLNKMTGSWGDINATSFYPGKNLGAMGDAGAVTTDHEDYAYKVKMLRNYGSRVKYENDLVGYNMRMDELQAAFLSVKLKYLSQWTTFRQNVAGWYMQMLSDTGDIILPFVHTNSTHVYHLFVIRSQKRDELQSYLQKCGIGTLIHYPIPPHLQKAFHYLGYKKGDYPVCELLSESSLSLPLYPGITFDQVCFVCEAIQEFFKTNYS